MSSLALTDAVLCLVATWLAARPNLATGQRLALGLLAIAALLGFLRFSGLYPLEGWHQLFSLMGASAALPLLAVCALAPDSVVAQRRQFALIFLGVAMLAGLLVSGLGQLRLYDQAVGLASMLLILVAMIKKGQVRQALGPVCMLAGSILFVAKVAVAPWLAPGDWLHLGMALGFLLLMSKAAAASAEPHSAAAGAH